MQRQPLETIAEHFVAHLECTQNELCFSILHQVVRGKPFTKAALAASLQVSQQELEQRLLQVPDTEFDHHGNIVGWGITLVPTRHRFQIRGQNLFTWCAFDTVLFPPTLGVEARVQSTCPATDRKISFVAAPEGSIRNLSEASSVMSLVIPGERRDCVRSSFCERSLFFWSEQAASSFLTTHPEALLLSIEEAAYIGKLVAQSRLKGAHSDI